MLKLLLSFKYHDICLWSEDQIIFFYLLMTGGLQWVLFNLVFSLCNLSHLQVHLQKKQ